MSRKSALPVITHLQFFVLLRICGREATGAYVRASLKRIGVIKDGPAFYQLMARLERAGLLAGRYHQKVIRGQINRQRLYHLTPDGEAAVAATRRFYNL